MNKKLCYIFILFMCLIFINVVYASEITVSLELENLTVVKGEEKNLTVKLTSDKVISSCQFKLKSEGDLVFVDNSISANTNSWTWSGNITDGFEVTKPNGNSSNPNGGIFRLKYKINDSGKIIAEDIKCKVEGDSTEVIHENVEISINAIEAVEDTTLKSLSIRDGTDFNFKSDVFSNYISYINSTNFALLYETNNPDYNDKVVVTDLDGNVISDLNNITFKDPTNQGGMPLTITVNDITKYTLLVSYRTALDNTLEYIKINGTLLDLNLFVNDSYDLEVSNDVNDINCVIALSDPENFKIGNNSTIDFVNFEGSVSIIDATYINIIVEPKDISSGGIKKEYTINIKKVGASTGEPDKEEVTPPPVKEEDDDEIIVNPATGDISMFVMVLILISSLIVSVILYRKNIENYK